MHAVTKFHFEIPAEIYRLAVVGTLAGLLTTAVIYSRNGIVPTEVTTKQTFIQPKNREQAGGRFTPTKDPRLVIADVPSLPRARPITPGFYYELVRAQGDGEDGEYVLTERRCIPGVDMPQPCYLPERGRHNFPLRRE
jgi:hypothetical protein